MISRTTKEFRRLLRELPAGVQKKARNAYETWIRDPSHGSLQFKPIHQREAIYSVRIALGWRAVGVRSGNIMIWYWIGSHADYDRLLARLRKR